MKRYLWTVSIAAFALAACGGEDLTGPSGSAAATNSLAFNPASPGAGFVPAATVAEQQSLADEIWSVLSAPPCWDASAIVQAAQPVGSATQFQFHSGNQFRHYGFSINFGAVLLHQVGRFQGLRTAIVETWTGEIEALVLARSGEVSHVFPHLNGRLSHKHTDEEEPRIASPPPAPHPLSSIHRREMCRARQCGRRSACRLNSRRLSDRGVGSVS